MRRLSNGAWLALASILLGGGILLRFVCIGPGASNHDAIAAPPAAAPSDGPPADRVAPELTDSTPFDPARATLDGKPVTEFLEQLKSGSDDERSFAALAMTHVWFGLDRFGKLSGSWGGMERKERQETLRAAVAGRISPRARVLVPPLVQALEDPSADVRRDAAYSLMMIGPEACAAARVLRRRLQDEDEMVRGWSARALYSVCLDVPAAIDANIALMRSKSAKIRSMAAYNLDLMGRDGSAAEPFLRELSDDTDDQVGRQARQALVSIRR